MPALHRGRLLKRWRYLGFYGPEVMLCLGVARIGPVPQRWWAVWDRHEARLDERTFGPGGRGRVVIGPGAGTARDGELAVDLVLGPGRAIEVVSPDPGGYAWTAKRVAEARGRVRAAGREWELAGPALIDDSAGYHPRHTAWRWTAGCGRLADGRGVSWNLVEGLHDSPAASERTLWLEDEVVEVAPVAFDPDLGGLSFVGGERLDFSAEASRQRDDNLLVMRSRYEQPFGRFTGTLPGDRELVEGFGVMERHDARW